MGKPVDENHFTQDALMRHNVVSATDCTGLTPSALEQDQDAEHLREVYPVPLAKPRKKRRG